MTRPTAAQLDHARATREMPIVGAHTVGGPDGGPGIPGIHWSRTHGDLRIPHFVGLHAVQALPIVAVLLPAAWSTRRRSRLVIVAAASYAGLFALLLWQALAGESIARPSASMLLAASAWTIATASALSVASREKLPGGWILGVGLHTPGRTTGRFPTCPGLAVEPSSSAPSTRAGA